MATSKRVFRGLPVHDASTAEVVHIKKSDLVGGYTRLPNYCAVHHSLKRDLHKKQEEVWVYASTVFVLAADKTFWVRYLVSNSLRVQLQVHDQGGLMKEGDYVLKAPPKSQRFDAPPRARKRSTGKASRRPAVQVSERERPSYVVPEPA